MQFAAYEGGNLALVASENNKADAVSNAVIFGQTPEAMAAFSFAAMSGCLFAFDPMKSPNFLLLAGLSGLAGGLFLASAGFTLSGGAVALSSLEMARGGYHVLEQHFQRTKRQSVAADLRISSGLATIMGISVYAWAVSAVTRRSATAKRILDDRPLLTSSAIKAPMRFDMIGQSLLRGEWVTAAVGTSWLIGDGLVALNDTRLKARLKLTMRPAIRQLVRSELPSCHGPR
ncbi:hypothetical protein W911_03665 [Hyphomicrobium nitrativorans NL23]|uniref:Uncharacterized protein n=1 Tax=Hyphomicrobium nitrativorans NL23 TaxID=1029756 RepID=V5SH92_9HYPH|nr:hypothetical protein [Hyphomicrobium nitrativorans]AHB49903.1 hypothetical protein W911_03665 [Hyphomicrobium nitrativorans NL23]